MVHASTSAAGVRFFGSIKEGRGLKRSAREAGVHAEVGYRWLRERYLNYRRDGMSAPDVEAVVGFLSCAAICKSSEVLYGVFHGDIFVVGVHDPEALDPVVDLEEEVDITSRVNEIAAVR